MRLGFINILKLLFAFEVCFYHFFNVLSPNPYFPLGDLAVEVFVLIAGMFFFMGYERKKGTAQPVTAYGHLKKRFLRFLPLSLLGFMLALAVQLFLTESAGEALTLSELGETLSGGVWDVLMIKMNGMNDNLSLLNVPAWTLSAMLLSEFLICALICHNEALFCNVIAPFVILIGLGIWRHIPKATHSLWIGFTTVGLLRVFLLYCLSLYGYRLAVRIKAISFTVRGTAALTAAEFLCYLGSCSIILTQTSRNWRWVATLLFLFAVAFSVSGKSYSAKWFPGGKRTDRLGEWSMGIYLTHYPVMQLFRAWYPGETVLGQLPAFAASVLVASVVFVVLVRLCTDLCQRICRKLTARWIQSSPP